MSLFHDNKKAFNAKAIGPIIDAGRCLGIDFVSYDEILKNKEYLKNRGVLQEAPDEQNDVLGHFIEEVLDKQKVKIVEVPTCGEDQAKISVSQCLSSNGKSYAHCQGESSICVNGKWYSKTHTEAVTRCGPRSCYSTYAKRTFSHCEGTSSICVNGDWLSPREAKSQCSK